MSTQVAALKLADGRLEVRGPLGAGRPVRCASLLKPLLFWVASEWEPLRSDPQAWCRGAHAAVTVSANEPIEWLWRRYGATRLLTAVGERCGLPLVADALSFGRVPVTAVWVAHAYGALLAASDSGDGMAERLVGWMRAVAAPQDFDSRALLASHWEVDQADVALKAGWFCWDDEPILRTHLAAFVRRGDGWQGVVALTADRTTPELQSRYQRQYASGEDVISYHQAMATTQLHAALRQALAL